MECPVCFDDLCDEPCAVFMKSGQRVCSHALHERCAADLRTKVSPNKAPHLLAPSGRLGYKANTTKVVSRSSFRDHGVLSA